MDPSDITHQLGSSQAHLRQPPRPELMQGQPTKDEERDDNQDQIHVLSDFLHDLALRSPGPDGGSEPAQSPKGPMRPQTPDGHQDSPSQPILATSTDSAFLRLLPPEIISDIFASCVHSGSASSRRLKGATFDRWTPLALTSICSHLRQIALGTPRLWNRCAFDFDGDLDLVDHGNEQGFGNVGNAEGDGVFSTGSPTASSEPDASDTPHRSRRRTLREQVGFMTHWLSRSGSVPIDICVSTSEFDWTDETRTFVLEAVFLHHRRWRHVDLRLSLHSFRHLYNLYFRPLGAPPTGRVHNNDTPSDSQLQLHFPLLQNLMLKKPVGGSPHEPFFFDFSHTAPNITQFQITRLFLRSVRLRWENLVILELRQLFIDECTEILRQTPLVEELVIRRIISGSDGFHVPTKDSPIPLERLRVLDWVTDVDTPMGPFFDAIRTPKLEVVRFMPFQQYVNVSFPEDEIMDLVQRSGCRLRVVIATHPQEDFLFNLWAISTDMTGVCLIAYNTNSAAGRFPMDETIVNVYRPEGDRWDDVTYYLPVLNT